MKKTIFKCPNLVNIAYAKSKKQAKDIFVLKMHNNKINEIKQLLHKLVKRDQDQECRLKMFLKEVRCY